MLQFVREIPIRIVWQGTLSARRGFLFHLAAGFSKPIDPLSGMSVNLVLVDQWLESVKEQFSGPMTANRGENALEDLAAWLRQVQIFLSQRALEEGAKLQSLTLREERGWFFYWERSLEAGEVELTYSHFVESHPEENSFDLLKIYFTWLRVSGCDLDCQHEGFKILKQISDCKAGLIEEELKKFVGRKLTSGTVLKAVKVEHLGDKYSLEARM